MDRTERQKQSIKRWISFNGKATIEACTGFGKTRVSLTLIKSLIKTNPKVFILVVVPTESLKEQWMSQLIEWNLFKNTKVEIINTVVKNKYSCDLLIIDECHLTASDTFRKVFEVVSYTMILCLTATLERLDGKEILIKKFAPVCDTITLTEATREGWVSPIKEYVVLLDVDLSEYKEWDRKFNSYFAFFDWDFQKAMTAVKDWKFRNKYAEKLGVSPKEVRVMALDWMRCMQKRKNFVMTHPKKIEICKKILQARTDKKCITFSSTIKNAEDLKVGKVLHSKQSKDKNKEILEEFNKASSGVLCTSKAADQGIDIKGLSVGIIMSIDSSKIRKTQRTGRILRFEEGKTAELFTLVIRGTQEWRWFQNSNTTEVKVIDEQQLDLVLKGLDIESRERDCFVDTKYRF